MQFRGTTISFNGVNSTRYNLYLCNVGNGLDRQLGTGRSFSMEDGNLISVDDDNPTFDIQLVKLNKHGDPSPITDTELFEIKRWLYSPKDFKPLMIDRQPTVYYGMFVGGQIWQNECNQGYLTLQFQLNSGHAYTTQQNSVYRIGNSKDSDESKEIEIKLRSKHNYETYNEVDIEIEFIGKCRKVTIENFSTGQKMELDLNKEPNETKETKYIRIYNANMKQIIDLENYKVLLRKCFLGDFIHLVNGDNRIKITVEKGQVLVKFISQGKVII